YQSYFGLSKKLADSLRNNYTWVVLFLRPFPMHYMIKPVIRYTNKQNRIKTLIHPALISSKIPEMQEEHLVIASAPNTGIMHHAFASLNLLSGKIIGLDRWAEKYIMRELQLIVASCSAQNTKLIIAGPPVYSTHRGINETCKKLNELVQCVHNGK